MKTQGIQGIQGGRSAFCRALNKNPGRPMITARPRVSTTTAAASTRRDLLAIAASTVLVSLGATPSPVYAEPSVEILQDEPGFGTHAARKNDLLLLHYVGTLKGTGQVFDSTRGGLMYRDGGPGVFRPAIIRLGDPNPVPGLCKGLQQGLEGMTVGGKRTFVVPPELGFSGNVLAPYAIVPAGSTLQYEVELIRLSNKGPDELTKGIDRCGQGGAAQQATNCANIEQGEFLRKF